MFIELFCVLHVPSLEVCACAVICASRPNVMLLHLRTIVSGVPVIILIVFEAVRSDDVLFVLV